MLRNKIEKIKMIEKYYNEYLRKDLDIKAQEIVKYLGEYFRKYELKYELVYDNSIYDDLKLYDFTYRIKQPKSLFGKLIDKDYKIEFTEQELSNKNVEIDKFFIEMKDLIGVKIITNLYSDCVNVMKLLNETKDECNIKIDMTGDIPTNMKNGLTIYKMEASYDGYNFELQIKSKLDSTWGDLEHILFYKDYEFYHIKNNNKVIMNKIGILIRDLEDMMLSIRNAKTQFNLDYEIMTFNKDINSAFENDIISEMGNAKILEDYIDLLYNLYEKVIDGDYEVKIKKPLKNIGYVQDTDNILINQYRNIKQDSIKLTILEYVYLNWFTLDDIEKDYIIILEGYLRNLLTINFDQISKRLNREILIQEEVDKILIKIKEFGELSINKNIFLSSELLEEYYLILSSTNDYISQVENNGEEIFTFRFDEIRSDTVKDEIEKILFNLLLLDCSEPYIPYNLDEYDFTLILTEGLNATETLIDNMINENKFKEDYYLSIKMHLRKGLGGIINEKLCD